MSRLFCKSGAARFTLPLFLLWLSANTEAVAQNFWQQTNGPYGGHVWSLAINSTGHIFAGTIGGGVFRSTDNGDSWTSANLVLTNDGVLSLAINSSGEIFAGTYRSGVFRSTDNGGSWTPVIIGLTTTKVRSLAIQASGEIFAGTIGGGVFRSTDNGGSWSPANTGLTDTEIEALAINSTGHIFAGTIGRGVFRSVDNGGSWTEINNDLNAAVSSLASKASGEIFAGTNGGVFRSTNTGDSWTLVNSGLTNKYVYALAINASGGIFAGTSDGGVFRSADNGGTWTPVNAGLTNTDVRSLVINSSGQIFAGTDGGGVFRSTDNGGSWTEVNIGLTNKTIRPLAINSSGHLFAGVFDLFERNGGVFRSIDNGDSWTRVNTGNSVMSLAINSIGQIFAGTNGGGVFRSTDNGNSWTAVYAGLTNKDVRSLAINASRFIFAGTNGGGVFRSTNNGDSWMPVNTGLTHTEVLSLTFNDDGTAFAGTVTGGVFRSAQSTLDQTPPQVVHTPIVSQPSGQPILVQANATDDTDIDSVLLRYRRGGDVAFVAARMSRNVDPFQATIPASAVTSRGVEYFIVATNITGLTTRQPASGIFSIQVNVSDTGVVKASAQPGGNAQTAYRLISAPLDLDDKSPRSVLEDDLGPYDDTKWRFSELLPNQTYAEFPNTSPMTPGKAFWLIVKEAGKIIDTGAGKSNLSSKEFSLALHPRWNLIGNPFNFTIPLQNLRLKSGQALDLVFYNGDWSIPANLQPFEGYAVFNNSLSVDTLWVDPDLSSGTNVTSPDEEALWSIRIQAQCQQARDAENFAAVVAKTSRDWDERDRLEPPAIGECVSVYFPHPEWATPVGQQLAALYRTDSRPEPADGDIWELEVKTNLREKVDLTFDGLARVPPEFQVWLVDEALHISQDLRETNHYAVAGAGAESLKRSKLVVGKRDFAGAQLAAVRAIPMRYELSQNFPNPFNPATTIRYGLPRDERVTLKVYNLLGEEIVTLVDHEPRKAGYHVAIWDGRDQRRQTVASGIYFYQLLAGGFAMIKKAALMK
jgi:ligand-binding sensor domain-containing protein